MFDSFARQPGHRTVEGELLRVLREGGAIRDARSAHYEVASRTDAGVSAAWNVCAFDTEVDPRKIAHATHEVPGLWLLSAAPVPVGFSPRREAASKRYVYHVPEPDRYDWKRVEEAAGLFVGTHDFRNFCRPDRGVPTRRSLGSVGVDRGRLVFVAAGFLWEQVRRMTRAALDVGAGAATMGKLRSRLEAPTRRDPQPPAPPEGLVLERVEVPVGFPPISKARRTEIVQAHRMLLLRSRLYTALEELSAPTVRR